MNARPVRPLVAWLLLAAGLAGLGFATYRRSLEVPFLWDDGMTIVENPRLQSLWPFGEAGYAVQSTECGRPVVRLTLAVNHALGEFELGSEGTGAALARSLGIGGGALAVRGYHLFNLGVHVLCALLLFALVRRTLARFPRWSAPAPWLAAVLAALVAALWLVHPLQSEAVTYVTQRTELVMAFCYLATLLAALRALEGPRRGAWSALAVLACALGMASKEVMASAPLVVALYDRAFVFPSWREAWARRRGLYLRLAGTWLVLGALVATGPRSESVGFGLGVSAWEYAQLQIGVLWTYFRLALWPDELCLDYGTALSSSPGALLPGGPVLALALVATAWGLGRRPRLAFLPAFVFLVLAPSSSFFPIVSEIGAERRMYLPLAAFLVAAVLGLHALASAATSRGSRALALLGLVGLALLTGLALATARRVEDYRSGLSIWRDSVRRRPDNPRARNHLGRELLFARRPEEALAEFAAAMALPGCELEAFNNAGHALAAAGRLEDATQHFQELVRSDPSNGRAYEGLGVVALEVQRWDAAEAALRQALALGCGSANLHNNLGKALFFLGRGTEALQAFEQALALEPGHAGAAENLVKARELLGQE